jgi:two-component system, response regulator, stage 0 sporulation protein F
MNPAILLVDDDTIVLTLIHHFMHKVAPDYELLSVENGAAALALIAQRPVALIITDQHMPDMDGVGLTAAIKAAAPHCPVILITGSGTSEIYQRGQADGVDFFLSNPFRLDQLASMVRAALGR